MGRIRLCSRLTLRLRGSNGRIVELGSVVVDIDIATNLKTTFLSQDGDNLALSIHYSKDYTAFVCSQVHNIIKTYPLIDPW
jgi:hypothetical protein